MLHAGEGAWHRDGNEFVHIAAVEPDGVIHGVTRYQFDDQHRLVRSSYARRGEASADGWLLTDVAQTQLDGERTLANSLERERWQTALTRNNFV